MARSGWIRALRNIGRARSLVAVLVVVGLLAPIGLVAVPASAAVPPLLLFVAQGGSDTGNSCALRSQPCATVSRVLLIGEAGATIYVSGTIQDNFFSGYPVTITGVDAPVGSPAVIDGSTVNASVATAYAPLTLDHLTIRGGGDSGVRALSDLTVSNSTITGSRSSVFGGGIAAFNESGSQLNRTKVHVVNSVISGNTAEYGGGIAMDFPSDLTVTGSTISDNTATSFAGGIWALDPLAAPTRIIDSTISGNVAPQHGGVDASKATIVGSTFTGNLSRGAGAHALAIANGGTFELMHSTISGNGNSTTSSRQVSAPQVTAAVIGWNIFGPKAGGSSTLSCLFPSNVTNAGYNIDSGSTCSGAPTDLQNTSAQLGPLQANGGPTATMRPSPQSPAINRIPPGTATSTFTACPRADQRGVSGPFGGMTMCTIGAVEATTSQALTQPALAVTPTSGVVGQPLPLTTSGGAGAGATTFTATGIGCSLSTTAPATLSRATAGTCSVQATKAADGSYLVAQSPLVTVRFGAAEAALVITSSLLEYAAQMTLTTSGGSGSGALTYSVVGGSGPGCAITATTPPRLSSAGLGICTVQARKAGDSSFGPVTSQPVLIEIVQGRQPTVTVTATPASSTVGTSVQLTAGGGAGEGAYSLQLVSGTASGCAIDVATAQLSITTAGSCTVKASKAGTDLYQPAVSAPLTVTFALAPQTLTLTASPSSARIDDPVSLTATGPGTGTVTFTAINGTASFCSITAAELRGRAAGTCQIRATKAADTRYAAATKDLDISIARHPQPTLTVESRSGTYLTPLTLTTSGGTGTGAVTYAVVNGPSTTGCAVSTTTPRQLTTTTAGTCLVTATKAADAVYLATSSVQTTVVILQAPQAALTVTSTSGTFPSSLALTSTGGTGTGAVTYVAADDSATGCKVTTTAPYRLSSATFGRCKVTATKAQDRNYLAQASAATVVTFAGQVQSPVVVTSTSGSFGTPLLLTASGGSGTGAVTYATADGNASGCAVTAAPYRLVSTSAGTCLVTATKGADGSFAAQSSAQQTVTLGKIAQAPLVLISTTGSYLTPLPLTTAGGSGSGAVTFAIATGGNATGCAVSTTTPYTLSSTSAGVCKVTATKATDVNHLATSVTTDVTLGKAVQAALAVTSTSGTARTALTLTTSGGSGTGVVTYEVVAGGDAAGCEVTDSTPYRLSTTSAGTCKVVATKSPDANFAPVSSPIRDVTFAKATQAAVTVTSTAGTYLTALTLTSGGGSGTGAVTFTATNGSGTTGCAVSATPPYQLTSTSPGSCRVTATRATDAAYLARSSGLTTVTLAKATQAPLVLTSTTGNYLTPVALTTSGGSGTGAVTFRAVDVTATGCSISTSAPWTLSSTSTGKCKVTATKASDAGYLARSSTATDLVLDKAAQAAITLTSTTGTYPTAVTLAVSGGSGTGAVTFAVTGGGSASGCVVSTATPYKLSTTSAGSCKVVATKAGDANFAARSTAATDVTFAKATQAVLTLTSTAGTYPTPITLSTSGGSGSGAVTYTATNGNATGCAVSASAPFTLSSTSPGTCAVVATKATDQSYLVRTSASTTVTFAKAAQAPILLTSTAGTFQTPLSLTTSGGSGTGAITYSVTNGNATGCAVSASAPFTLSSTSAGTCQVTATKAGDATYLARSSIVTTVTFAKRPQAGLTVTSLTGSYATPIPLVASGGSGTGAITYAVVNGTAGGCTVSAATPYKLSSSSAGTCIVTATKAGDATFLAVSSAPTPVTFERVAQAALVVTSTSGTFLDPLRLTTGGGTGAGAVTFTATDGTATGCTISTTTPYELMSASAGTCTVTASKAADVNHLGVVSAPGLVSLAQAHQAALVVTSTTGRLFTPLELVTSGGSGTGAVTYTVTDGTATDCTISTEAPFTLTTTSDGTCEVTAARAGDADFLPVVSEETTVTIGRAVQAEVLVTSTSGTYSTPLELAITGGSGNGALTFRLIAGGTAAGCRISQEAPFTLSTTSTGTCRVSARKAGDTDYLPAVSAATTITIDRGAQAPLTVSSTGGTFATPLELTVGGGSGTGVVTFTAVDGTATACAVSEGQRATLSSATAGTCVVTATSAGDGNFLPITSEPAVVTFAPATQADLVVTSIDGELGSPLVLTTSGGSGTGGVTYAVVDGTATGCAVSEPHEVEPFALTATTAGTCLVTATRAGDTDYLPALSAPTTVTVSFPAP